jgi:protoporphyrin/coproporphyrin ferrochelatase
VFRAEWSYEYLPMARIDTQRELLLVGHGTITRGEDVPEFLLRIRRGRPASPELVGEIQRRYRAIGRSPLLEVTEALGRGLSERLGFPAHVAMRFWAPLIEDVLKGVVERGVRELCILPVAPFSVHVYVGVVEEALGALAAAGATVPRLVPVAAYGTDPALVRAHADVIAPLLAGRDPATTELVLTAHSLPVRVLAAGDPYQTLFEASARAVADSLHWPATIAYQSQGEGGGEWVGPTLDATLDAAPGRGKRDVVVAPVGFLADHVETLYDLDIEAAARAARLGLGFSRAPALGAAPALADALTGVVRRALA